MWSGGMRGRWRGAGSKRWLRQIWWGSALWVVIMGMSLESAIWAHMPEKSVGRVMGENRPT